MYEVQVEQTFAAAHALRNYKGSCENLHGHNFKVQVTITGEKLDKAGMLVDFLDVKKVLREIMAKVDHQNLNELPPFDEELNPSAENLAKYFHDFLANGLEADGVPIKITEVRIWETDIQSAAYRP